MPGIIGPGPGGVDRAADAGRVIAGDDGTRWAGVSHDEIWAMVQQGDPVAASEAASFAWMKTQLLIQSIEERLSAVVSGTAADWEGAAANAARGAVSALGQWAIDGAAGARSIGQTLLDQSHEALHVRQQMPEPRTQALTAERDKFWTDPGYVFGNVLDGFSDLRALEEQAENDAQRARELMAQYEARSRGENIPRLQEMTPPPQITVDIGPAATPPSGAGLTTPLPGAPVSVGPAGATPAGQPAIPGAPLPPVGEVPAPPASVLPGAPTAVPPGGPTAAPGAVPPGAAPTAVPPVPPAQAPPLPTPGTNGASTPPATPPATQFAPFPAPGTTGPGVPAAPPLPAVPGTALPPSPLPGFPPRPGTSTAPLAPRPGGVAPGLNPLPRPTPGWRDVVQSNAGGPGARPVPEAPVRSAPFGERPPAGVAEPATRPGAPRPGAAQTPGLYPPLAAGMGAGGQDREHRRASFLIDDTGAFADDRWFPPAVITPDV